SYASLEDDYDGKDRKVGENGLAEFWPGNAWYKPYIGEMPAVYYPRINIGGGGFGKGSYWYQHPRHWSYSAHMRQTRGIHNWKVGFENRLHHSDGIFPNLMNFSFPAALTSDTFISPNTARRGDEWATFLLGAVDGNSNSETWPFQRLGVNFWAGFIHDDIKLSQRITLNLGLRYEFETAPRDLKEPQLSRYLDLTQPVPEMQNNPPQIPADVTAIRTKAPTYNGAWIFTDSSNRGTFNTDKTIFMPRAGIAIRVNDKTAFRAGYARYVVPPLIVGNTLSRLSMPYYSSRTTVAPLLEGIPQARLSDPFPAANPLILPKGNSLGRYTNLGDSASWYTPELRTGVNDRINFSLQRELPNRMNID
ncbi:MAG: TonB-dependent receptor domain-containing protein, partial [Gammaproteobacteria bacterium]